MSPALLDLLQADIAGPIKRGQSMAPDFSRTSAEQLKRSLRFHENDNGTMTADEECRRMFLVQEISAELKRRGLDPWRDDSERKAA